MAVPPHALVGNAWAFSVKPYGSRRMSRVGRACPSVSAVGELLGNPGAPWGAGEPALRRLGQTGPLLRPDLRQGLLSRRPLRDWVPTRATCQVTLTAHVQTDIASQ